MLISYLRNYPLLPFAWLMFVLFACNTHEHNLIKKGKVIAEVGSEKLYEDDIQGLVMKKLETKDSLERIQRYVQSWVQKQLLIQKAKKEMHFDEAEIERKILDYKYSLMAYEYEKRYTNAELNKKVIHKEIEEYYKKNLDNFQLKENIVKAWLIKMSTDKVKKTKIKDYLKKTSSINKQKVKNICGQHAINYTLQDTTWVSFDKLVTSTPFAKIPNKVDFIRNNHFAESVENNFSYFLVIKEYKVSNQTSPLNFVREEIEGRIINQRRVKLIRKLEQKIFEEAKENRSFKIYKN